MPLMATWTLCRPMSESCWVPATGPLDASCVLVGRDPGFHEMQQGKPFVGPSGRLLNQALARAKLNRAALLVTNVVGTQPPGNDFAFHSPANLERGLAALDKLLRAAPRRLIVALGSEALHACLGLDQKVYSVTEVRGYVFEGPYGPVLATLHPAFLLRAWHPNWALLNYDIAKAARLLSALARAQHYDLWVPHLEMARWAVDKCLNAELVAVDIETDSDLRIACLAVSWDGVYGVTFPWRDEWKDLIQVILGHDKPRKVFQNGQFDVTILERHGLSVANWDDTMLMWHALEPALAGSTDSERKKGKKRTEKSLRFLASIFTEEPWFKNYNFQSDEDRWKLNAVDARVTWEVARELEKRLQCA